MTIFILAPFPVVVHIALCILAVVKNKYIPLHPTDLLVHFLVVCYGLVILLILRRKKLLTNILTLFYTLFFMAIFIEAFVYFCIKPNVCFPWPPNLRWIGRPAEGAMPGVGDKIEFSINKYGLRGPRMDLEKADYKILVIGGSAAECMYVSDNLSWPWKLQDEISNRTHKRCFIGNASRSSTITLDHINILLNYKLAPRFDLIIVLCGINDIGRVIYNDRGYFRNSQEIAKHNFNIFNRVRTIYYRDSIIFSIIKAHLIKNNGNAVVPDRDGRWYIAQRQIRKDALKKNAINEVPPNLDEGVSAYKSNLKVIIEICRSRGQKLLLLTQPTLWQAGLSKELTALLWEHKDREAAYTPEVLEKMTAAYNEALIEVCIKYNVPYLDLASALPHDTSVFYDDCHFNISGCGKIADLLSPVVIKLMQTEN